MIGAACLGDGQLLVARGGRDHGRAQHLPDLNGGESDAAASAMHQQHLAGFDPAAIDQCMIGGAVAGEIGRSFRIVERRGHRRELRGRHHRFVGEGAMTHLHDDLVAHGNASRLRVHFGHVAGSFHARRERQLRLELIFAGRHQHVRKIETGGADRDAHLTRLQGPRWKLFQPQRLGCAERAADDSAHHQAALALRRLSAWRISGRRSLPKYMSVLSTKIVGEPKPPRATTSSVLALSWSLIPCSEMPAKNFCSSMPAFLQISASTESCEMSLSPPQYASNTAVANGTISLPSQIQPRMAFTLFTGNTVGGILIERPAEWAQS